MGSWCLKNRFKMSIKETMASPSNNLVFIDWNILENFKLYLRGNAQREKSLYLACKVTPGGGGRAYFIRPHARPCPSPHRPLTSCQRAALTVVFSSPSLVENPLVGRLSRTPKSQPAWSYTHVGRTHPDCLTDSGVVLILQTGRDSCRPSCGDTATSRQE